MPNWLTSEKLREVPPTADAAVRKYFTAEKLDMLADQPRRVRFVISTNDVDRDNDTVDPTGWDLSNYKNNPVVLWAHSHKDLPVARAISVTQEGNSLIAEAEFATHPFAETVYQLIKGGFLRAVSVGFRAMEYAINVERGGIDFKRQELLEFSVCPVPANPMALISASAAGVDLDPVAKWVEDLIDQWPTGELKLSQSVLTKLHQPAKVSDNAILSKLIELSADVASLKVKMTKDDVVAPPVSESPAEVPAEPVTPPVAAVEPVAAEVVDGTTNSESDADGIELEEEEGVELLETPGDSDGELQFELDDPLLELAMGMEMTKSELEQSLRDVISSAVTEVTQSAVVTAINQARGRLD